MIQLAFIFRKAVISATIAGLLCVLILLLGVMLGV
jgi:hypothetical protein